MNRARRLLSSLIGGLVLSASACGALATSAPAPPQLSPCHVEGAAEALSCGTFVVPEDRSKAGGRQLALEVAVLKARADRPREPVFFLAGGPGQDATHAAAGFAGSPLRREHDIVLMDTRGTGAATALDCPTNDSQALQADLDPLFSDLSPYALCAERLSRKADLALYTTPIAMRDLEDLRRALGYQRIDLYGGSYGTRAGLVYLRMFGGHVRAAVFSGMVAFENPVPLYHAAAAERALERLFAECAADAACHATYPEPMRDLQAVLSKLAASPAHLTVKHPASGVDVAVALSPAGFANGLRVMLYTEEGGRAIPRLLSLARAGDYAPFAAAAVQSGYRFGRMGHIGVLLSVSCSEDIPRIRRRDIGPATAGSIFGDVRVKNEIAACTLWPRGRLPANYARPFASPVPTLILSGELDPVTPPRWGEVARKTLPNSRHIVLPGAHVPEGPCVDDLLTQMFETADPASIDAACVAKIAMPPFQLGAPPTESRQARSGAVEQLARDLEEIYIVPEIGGRYAAALRAHLMRGDYDKPADTAALARVLSADLQAVHPDRHLHVSLADDEAGRKRRAAVPSGQPLRGVEETRWIAPGIAYIRFSLFSGSPEEVATVKTFMDEHTSARAIIIDAREHHGGGLAEMDVMLPYLYARKTVLVGMDVSKSVVARAGDPLAAPSLVTVPAPAGILRREYVVAPNPIEHRLFEAKVFYLTSTRTASAAEHLALAFKRTHRVTLVGEHTAGANHCGGDEPLGAGLSAFVPVGRTFAPDTGEDWEGRGVLPDVAVPAEQALAVAVKLAKAVELPSAARD